MKYTGFLEKMLTEIGNPIQYYLNFNSGFIHVNELLSKEISITHIGYHCLNCALPKKIFRQGCCYDCFYSSPMVGDWVIRPELSKAHLEIEDRDLAYEKKVQLQPHIVYLALNDQVKVGVTRKSQIPTRWIDQGATQAISIIEAPNRYLAGITEVMLKNYYSDKTSWQKMLTAQPISMFNLQHEKKEALTKIPKEVTEFISLNDEVITLSYPVLFYPLKATSISLEKEKNFSSKLIGIKGQYLIFKDGNVFNVRSHEGFVVNLEF